VLTDLLSNANQVPVTGITDFNDKVRCTAVFWTPMGVGQAEHDTTLHDPVVVTASLRRGDERHPLLDTTHADGPAGHASFVDGQAAG